MRVLIALMVAVLSQSAHARGLEDRFDYAAQAKLEAFARVVRSSEAMIDSLGAVDFTVELHNVNAGSTSRSTSNYFVSLRLLLERQSVSEKDPVTQIETFKGTRTDFSREADLTDGKVSVYFTGEGARANALGYQLASILDRKGTISALDDHSILKAAFCLKHNSLMSNPTVQCTVIPMQELYSGLKEKKAVVLSIENPKTQEAAQVRIHSAL